MGYYQLLKQNLRTIGFGFLHTFFSGLGQTHFVSLYTPLIMAHFALSATEYGSLYSIITLISGFTITFIGPWIDRFDARYFSAGIGLGLLCSLGLILPMQSLVLVSVGLFGLRLFGQGLSSSLASITVARYFNEGRGKALSLSQLGYPVYEGLITPLGAYLIHQVELSLFIGILAATLLLVYLPFGFLLTRNLPDFNKVIAEEPSSVQDSHEETKKSWTRKEVFTSLQVYLLMPQVLMPPFALTGLFFHQALIAENKNWSLALMASGLLFFATGRIINTFITGPLVDKHSATRLFPFYQIPLALGFAVMAFGEGAWTPALSFSLFGLSVGCGGPIKSAIWAELYGTKHLGAIKSLFATFMVLSTGASPALFGWVLDLTQNAHSLLYTLFVSSLVAAFMAWVALRKNRSTES